MQVLAVVVFLALVAGFYAFTAPFLEPRPLQYAGIACYSALVSSCRELSLRDHRNAFASAPSNPIALSKHF